MKKLLFVLMFILSFTLMDCKKEKQVDVSACWDSYQKALSNDLKLYQDNFISYAEYLRRNDAAKTSYESCINQ